MNDIEGLDCQVHAEPQAESSLSKGLPLVSARRESPPGSGTGAIGSGIPTIVSPPSPAMSMSWELALPEAPLDTNLLTPVSPDEAHVTLTNVPPLRFANPPLAKSELELVQPRVPLQTERDSGEDGLSRREARRQAPTACDSDKRYSRSSWGSQLSSDDDSLGDWDSPAVLFVDQSLSPGGGHDRRLPTVSIGSNATSVQSPTVFASVTPTIFMGRPLASYPLEPDPSIPILAQHQATITSVLDWTQPENSRMIQPAWSLASEAVHPRISFILPTLSQLRASQHINAHRAVVQHLQFSPDGKWLATCSLDRTAIIWKVGDPFIHHNTLRNGTNGTGFGLVRQFAWSPSGKYLLTRLLRSVKVWIPEVRQRLHRTARTPGKVVSHHTEQSLQEVPSAA